MEIEGISMLFIFLGVATLFYDVCIKKIIKIRAEVRDELRKRD